MSKYLEKAIAFVFYLLFLSVPLVLFPKTSEIFEFNKMVTVYFLTVVISSLWVTNMISRGKIIFRRTALDIPLFIFLLSQLASTLFSVDMHTSMFGYYSRFNGGFFSSLSYGLLYWAYVSNMDSQKTKKSLHLLFLATFISCIWAIFEHFGRSFSCLIFPDFRTFDVSCWVQDVKTRVYATFGQPNWLAAWLTAIIPLTWTFALSPKKIPPYIYHLLNLVFFVTLLYTKSRSGILAFAITFLIFWGGVVLKYRDNSKSIYRPFLIVVCGLSLVILLVGTPWTPNLKSLLAPTTYNPEPKINQGPALETGGTESGKIRQIVWKGALEIWKNYPVFGSGVETFAYSYYQFRPVEHNYVSEWDYLYNKAHNEYLNFAATTGTVGILSYLFLIVSTLLMFFKNFKLEIPALAAGYVSILVTNFFGFSVVPSSLLFFLLPAFAVSLGTTEKEIVKLKVKLNLLQKVSIPLTLLTTFYLLFSTSRYWYSDYIYAKGRYENDSGNHETALKTLSGLIKISSKEPVYWNELADSSTYIALDLLENKNSPQLAKSLADSAVAESKTAISLSPANVNLKRSFATRLENLSGLDPSHLLTSITILSEAQTQAPTDAKLRYQLSVDYLRTGDYKNAIKEMEQAVNLKSDYEKARFALALMYIDIEEFKKAKDQLEYILEKINPDNAEVKKELSELNSKEAGSKK